MWGCRGGPSTATPTGGSSLSTRVYAQLSCWFHLRGWFCSKAPASQEPVQFVLLEGNLCIPLGAAAAAAQDPLLGGESRRPPTYTHTLKPVHTWEHAHPCTHPGQGPPVSLPRHPSSTRSTHLPDPGTSFYTEAGLGTPSPAPGLENQTPFLLQRMRRAGLGLKTFVGKEPAVMPCQQPVTGTSAPARHFIETIHSVSGQCGDPVLLPTQRGGF